MDSEYSLTSILHSIAKLAVLIENVMDTTSKLFRANDLIEREKAWSIIEELSTSVEEIRKAIIENILVYIAKTQPLGKDLVTSYVILNVTYDAYRVTRYCREIARVDKALAPSSSLSDLGLGDLFEKALEAIRLAMRDLSSLKPISKEKISEIDRYVDALYEESIKSIIEREITTSIKALRLLVVRHIERIVDHANYIEQYLSDLAE